IAGYQNRNEPLNLGAGNNTTLSVHAANGTSLLAYNNDRASGDYSSLINYVATTTGTFYVKATRSGGYRSPAYTYDLRITTDPPPVVTAPVASLQSGQILGNPSAGVYT